MKGLKDNSNVLLNGKHSVVLIFVLFFLLNFILKIIYLNSRDIANDEPFTIYWAQAGLNEIIKMLPSENNPPFHFFLLHFWIKLFGISPFSVRFLSLCFSAFTAVIIFIIGNKFYNRFTGITAGLIFTFSTMHVFFSHEARVYSLFAFLTAISLYLFLRISEKPDKKNFYIFLFFTNFILIYSHYFGFFILFIEAVSTLLMKQKGKMKWRVFIMMTCLVLSYIPIVMIFLERFFISQNYGTWVTKPELGQFYGFLNLFINNRINMVMLILLIITGGILNIAKYKFVLFLKNLFSENTIIIFLWFLVPYLLMFFISFKTPMFIERYVLYTSIPFYILIAILINNIFSGYKLKYITAFIFILSLIFTLKLNPDNFRRISEVVSLSKKIKTDNSIILIAPDYADMGFTYYYNINYFKDYKNYRQHLNDDRIYPVSSEDQVKNIIKSCFNNCIYIQAGSEFQDPKNKIYNYISSKYKNVSHYKVYQIYLIHKFYN